MTPPAPPTPVPLSPGHPTFIRDGPDSGRSSPKTYVRDDPDAARKSPPTYVRDDPEAVRKRLGSPTPSRSRALSPSRANYLPVVGKGLFPKEIEQETIVNSHNKPISSETLRREYLGLKKNGSGATDGRSSPYGVQLKSVSNSLAPKAPILKTVNWAPHIATSMNGRNSSSSVHSQYSAAGKTSDISSRSRSRSRDDFLHTEIGYQSRLSSRNSNEDKERFYRSTSVPALNRGKFAVKTHEWSSDIDDKVSDEELDQLFSDVYSQLDQLNNGDTKIVATSTNVPERRSETPFEAAVRDAFNDIKKDGGLENAREIEISTREIHRKVTITTTPKQERKFPLADSNTMGNQRVQLPQNITGKVTSFRKICILRIRENDHYKTAVTCT
ncbi:uncharacterized protein LOC129597274 [Paramacrobiotus metropolitanus]|uniref:uncharacterized protein LOC129597274 n=1 Tax=Paramacrobiotus metropolitanus TaxID=2943436 RepID=UPI0024457098|nr:uncharacterized protein LOC129597274 [Paramacrobiotus metropolitanus]